MFSKLNKFDYYVLFDSRHLPGVTRTPSTRYVWMVPYDIDLDEVPCNVGVRRQNMEIAHQYGYL
jgi:hypothetical protein